MHYLSSKLGREGIEWLLEPGIGFEYSRRAGRSYHCVWGTGQTRLDNFLDTITKIEFSQTAQATVTTWTEPCCFPGEPVFVARPEGMAEDDGVLLSVVLDANAGTSFLLVLNAATLAEGLPCHITSPLGFMATTLRAAFPRASYHGNCRILRAVAIRRAALRAENRSNAVMAIVPLAALSDHLRDSMLPALAYPVADRSGSRRLI